MAQVQANGITIEYEDYGPKDAPVVLLIMGLSAQLTLWPIELVDELVERGYRVIRYDNRDVGLSTKFDEAGVPNMIEMFTAAMSGKAPAAPYSLEDMAADAVGLMDVLGIDKAHIVGASMGGMIAQLVAADYPERALSLTSIMSSSGNPSLPQGKPEAMAALMSPAPDPNDAEAIVERGINVWRVIGSPGYQKDEAELRDWVRAQYERSYYPDGVVRQMAAIMANGDRREKLKTIKAPTVVIHGADDPLVPLEGGKDTAESIPGAELCVFEGMGHDVPEALVGEIADAITSAAKRAGSQAAAE